MSDERWAPGACLLENGNQALIAGGFSYRTGGCVSSIDIFDENQNRFHLSHARLSFPRDFVEANLLPNGDVLLSGGYSDVWASMNVADIYDPATDTCRLTKGRMYQHRELMTATSLTDGRVILIGGLNLWQRGTTATAEIFNPATELFTPTVGNMAQDRFGHAACRLLDGRVFVVGGTHWNLRKRESTILNNAEIYDPATDHFTQCAGQMSVGRDRPTASLLPDGKVLVYGGQGPGGQSITTAELYDPATDSFSIVGTNQTPRMAHSAVTLRDGNILISGGWDADTKSTTATCLVYDPLAKSFKPLPDLPFASHDAALLVLGSGEVLDSGGKTVSSAKEASADQVAVISF